MPVNGSIAQPAAFSVRLTMVRPRPYRNAIRRPGCRPKRFAIAGHQVAIIIPPYQYLCIAPIRGHSVKCYWSVRVIIVHGDALAGGRPRCPVARAAFTSVSNVSNSRIGKDYAWVGTIRVNQIGQMTRVIWIHEILRCSAVVPRLYYIAPWPDSDKR